MQTEFLRYVLQSVSIECSNEQDESGSMGEYVIVKHSQDVEIVSKEQL